MTTPVTTSAIFKAPDVFDAGSRAHFSVAADLREEEDLRAFVLAISARANVVEIGTPLVGACRFAIENNGVTAAQLSTLSGETVTDFAY